MHRLDTLLLAGVGVLLTHQGAYAIAGFTGHSSLSHDHLTVAWIIGSIALLLGLTRTITSSLKKRSFSGLSPIALTGFIAMGYAGMELIERLSHGYEATALLSEPVFWIGLLAAPLVAVLLGLSVRTVAEIALAWVEQPTRRWQLTLVEPAPATLRFVPAMHSLDSVLSRRGPPVR